MKKAKTALLILLAMVLACCLASCKEDPVQIGVTLDKASLDVAVGAQATLTATVTGSDAAAVWSSDDPSVATVDNGTVAGVKTGKTTIRATVGDACATCEVTVTRPGVVGTLTIDYETLELLVGKTADVRASVDYKGQTPAGLTYRWEVDGDACRVTGNGATATIEGVSAGRATVSVSCVHLGETLVETMTVIVKNDLSLTIADLPFEGDRYILTLVTDTPDGYTGDKNKFFAPSFTVEANGQTVTDAAVTIRISDADLSVVEYDAAQGKLIAKGAGEAVVHCTYTMGDTEYTVDILVTVELPHVTLGSTYLLETGRDRNLLDAPGGTATAVLVGDTAVEFENTDDGILVKNIGSLPFGVHTLLIRSDTAVYTAEVEVVTLAIADKADLDAMATIADKGNGVWDGYFVLANDIAYNGIFRTFCGLNHCTGWGGTTGFVGTFDGRGHVIEGLTISADAEGRSWFGGMFGVQGSAGDVKNVGFVNATLAAGDASAIVSDLCYGTVSNVFVEVNLQGGTRCAGVARALFGKIENTIVYLTGAKPDGDGDFAGSNLALVSFMYDGAVVNNCFSVGGLELYRSGGDAPVIGAESDTLKKFATLAEMQQHTFGDSWADVWTTVDGMPVFAAYLPYAKANVENAITNDTTTKVDRELVLAGAFGYAYRLKEPVEGIELRGNVVTVNGVYDVSFTIVATCIFDPTVTIEKTFTTVGVPTVDLDESFDIDKSLASTVLSFERIEGQTVKEVYLAGARITFTQDGSQLTLSGYADVVYGPASLTIVTDRAIYNVKALLAVLIGSTEEWDAEVTASLSNPGDWNKYYVLTADLDYTGKAYTYPTGGQYGATFGFKGVFDGRNHKIFGLVIRGESKSFFGTIAMSATVRNVAFVGCSLSFFEADGTTFISTNKSGIVADLLYGTLENVFVQGNLTGHWWCGGVAYFVGETATVRHCIVQAEAVSGDKCASFFAAADSKATLIGCYAVAPAGSVMMLVGADPGAGTAFTETTDVRTVAAYADLAGGQFDSWDSAVWNKTDGYPQFIFA